MEIHLKTKDDIEKLSESGRILAIVLRKLKSLAKEGVSLLELNHEAHLILNEYGAKAAFFGYKPEGAEFGFPGYICASVNNQVVHGIPRDYKLKNGDVLKIDFGVDYKNMITDAALTVPIGNISPDVDKLIKTTKSSLEEAINVCKPGNHLGDIGWIIEKTVEENGFKIIRSLGGHGVGFELHEDPSVLNFGSKGTGMELVEGLVIAIEPITAITSREIFQDDDESFVTIDGGVSAHFEKTIAIIEGGCKVLTPWDLDEENE
jgi:methionyl aminopeptidase